MMLGGPLFNKKSPQGICMIMSGCLYMHAMKPYNLNPEPCVASVLGPGDRATCCVSGKRQTGAASWASTVVLRMVGP